MFDQQRLLELTQSYLKSLICSVSGSLGTDFDSRTPFAELGVDSFRVLMIIKALEADFGRLPKTLLFENFNIDDLASYFVGHHAPALYARFEKEAPVRAAQTPAPAVAQPMFLLERQAYADPELGGLLRKLFEQYKNEGSVSRGTRTIAPNLLLGSERRGFFNYSRSKQIILAYAYTGPKDYFPTLAGEMYEHCAARGLELNILAGEEITAVGAVPFSATPFGVIQRILDLQKFTLEGGAMRRLRYQVSKFEKSGKCRTVEYRCGSDPPLARSIADVIDQWCSSKTMVNPLIHLVKEEILSGSLSPEHRIFLTWVDDVLQNVILISPLAAEQNGYLMDLEFYAKDMPLGGLEFAIVKIIEMLVAEGCDMLSLGGTYGCKLQSSANADPEVDRILDELRMQNIFNDEGNLQFKNKFRPQNSSIFLCRPVGRCVPDNVIDVIMMIADPAKMQTSDEENQLFGRLADRGAVAERSPDDGVREQVSQASPRVLAGERRSVILAEYGFNPLNVPNEHITFDLKTDSWSQLAMPAIKSHMEHLHAQLLQPMRLEASLKAIFPFVHFALLPSGRAAEGAFYRVWPEKGIVPQNLLFPTNIFHQLDKGFSPRELPHPEVFRLGSQERYKGNLDYSALEKLLTQGGASIAFVCVEVSDNASGGQPVSIEHLKKVKALLKTRSVALVMDATRVMENARFIIEADAAYAGKTVWEVSREILSYADTVIVSLAKDFCVPGGLIATNDTQLFRSLEQLIREEGSGLDVIGRKLVAVALQDRDYIESGVLRRKEAVERIWSALRERGVPVVTPAGGHCVLIDVGQIQEFKDFKYPVASFLAWMYLNSGIRAAAHNAGMQKDTALNALVRLAVPIGLKRPQVDEIVDALTALFDRRRNIPEVEPAGSVSMIVDIHAKYRLVRYHHCTEGIIREVGTSAGSPVDALQSVPVMAVPERNGGARDIAIVGMAGRYPGARNPNELWENLLRGADCIDYMPQARLQQRLHPAFNRKYRGGFLDDVDKFDARFFNISPEEARMLDPQERLFLEVAYETLEDAGYYAEALGRDESSREVGVFVGAVWSLYQMLGVEAKLAGGDASPNSFLWSIANRVSYWMNLSGPSLTVDTACSGSLTAISLACEAIRAGDCSAAIVGGVNLDSHQTRLDISLLGGAVSKDGACRSFGKGADGYVLGEGVAALFLKPLDQAIVDGDNVYGVIKGVAVAHSGRTSGYTVPGPQSQARLILKALERANVDPRSIGYIEAHGTGTELGDSIEMSALCSAFQKYGVEKHSCSIGSIKTNIGHLEAASGIVGVQKVLLQMKHRKLVSSLHSAQLNESIDFASSPFYVQQQVADWKGKELEGVRFPLRAGINALGAGGTNAHLILEEYRLGVHSAVTAAAEPVVRIFPISARTEDQLRGVVMRLREYLQDAPEVCEGDIAFTLQRGRRSFDHRLCVLAKTRVELVDKLSGFLEGGRDEDVMVGHVKNAAAMVAFLSSAEKRDFINLVSRSGDPRRLARLWSEGVLHDWHGLSVDRACRRISLPTYPFADERYWLARAAATLPVSLERSGSASVAVTLTAESSSSSFVSRKLSDSGAQRGQLQHSSAPGELLQSRSGYSVQDKARLFVLDMFASRLQVSIDDLDEDCHLMDSGLTSIDMAEMTLSLKERIDRGFSPVIFFECVTIRDFYELLANKYAAVFQVMAVEKQGVERVTTAGLESKSAREGGKPGISVLPLHVQDAQSALALPVLEEAVAGCAQPLSCVLITGATGFLGVHLLSDILSSNPEGRALCLVRAENKEQALARIMNRAEKFDLTLDPTRIVALCGDFAQPRLGLSHAEWELCCTQAQRIVHCAARVNHIEGYATFRDSTHGMKEIIKLASTYRLKLVQFISSVAACYRKAAQEFTIFEKEAFIDDGLPAYGGYGQSKWAQETLLKRAHEHDVPYVVYRFGELSGSTYSGLGQTDDMLHRLLQMRLAVGCREKISTDVLDMLPVDFAAKLINETARAPHLWNTVVHATHPKPYSLAGLYEKVRSRGLQFDVVTRAHYLAECYEFVRFINSVNPVNGFVLECVLRDVEGSVRNRKMMDAYFSVLFPFEQENFHRALRILGLSLPEWDGLLESYLDRWSREDCGFMARVLEYRKWRGMDEAHRPVVPGRFAAIGGSVAQRVESRSPLKKELHESALLAKAREA